MGDSKREAIHAILLGDECTLCVAPGLKAHLHLNA